MYSILRKEPTMTDTTLPPAPPAAPPKSGITTTEFALNLAAAVVGALLASGVLADGSLYARLAGMAAMVLSSLGYTWSRTAIKAAAPLLLVGLFMAQATACGSAKPALGTGAVTFLNCEDGHLDAQSLADAKAFAAAEVQHWLTGGAAPSSDAIRADLAPIRSDLGKCAIAAALAAVTAVQPAARTLSAAAPDLRAMFSAEARGLGWAPVQVADGVIL
jgi:hypothetical protein